MAQKYRKLRIGTLKTEQCAGYGFGVSVIDVESGEPIALVQSVTIKCDTENFATAEIVIGGIEVDAYIDEAGVKWINHPDAVQVNVIDANEVNNESGDTHRGCGSHDGG